MLDCMMVRWCRVPVSRSEESGFKLLWPIGIFATIIWFRKWPWVYMRMRVYTKTLYYVPWGPAVGSKFIFLLWRLIFRSTFYSFSKRPLFQTHVSYWVFTLLTLFFRTMSFDCSRIDMVRSILFICGQLSKESTLKTRYFSFNCNF